MTIRQRLIREGDTLYNVWEQPDRRAVLEENARQRNAGGARSKSWIGAGLRIPLEDHERLKRERPDIFRDKRELARFMASSESDPYRINPRRRKGG